ncbi:MAG TPA: hypothetical protein PLF42_15930 [Anaerolineales bacterium]|nr:hypothetical protein [Anaerolineales bacterium]
MPTANSRNRFDKKDSLELGNKAEDVFMQMAKAHGWKISASTKEQNIDEHWDFLIEKDDQACKVEVKSEKRIQRDDVNAQAEFIWVELRNVRGKIGWLFGTADLIAFEKGNAFVFVKRLDLLGVVNQNVDLVAKVKSAKEALYKIYTRDGRKDKLTLLPFRDIEPIIFMEWKK